MNTDPSNNARRFYDALLNAEERAAAWRAVKLAKRRDVEAKRNPTAATHHNAAIAHDVAARLVVEFLDHPETAPWAREQWAPHLRWSQEAGPLHAKLATLLAGGVASA